MSAEKNDHYKQIVTYIIVKRGEYVLSFTRGNYNREALFLRGSLCIGFGGHVTEEDMTLFDFGDQGISNSAIRELSEELLLPKDDKVRLSRKEDLKFTGILNDDSSSVGQRHIAFVMEYQISDSEDWQSPRRGETSITKLAWEAPGHTDVETRSYEYCSQLCFREYYSKAFWFFLHCVLSEEMRLDFLIYCALLVGLGAENQSQLNC